MNLRKFNFKIDNIILKTLMAVAICILTAYITGNHIAIFFGGVASIVCMQHTYKHTLKSGGYRFLGTLIGGFIGILTMLVNTLVPQHLIGINAAIIALSSILAIYLCNFLNLSDSTFVNCVVFLNVVSNYDGKTGISPAFLYVSERVIYTLIGIDSAYLINRIIYLHKNNYKTSHIGGKIINKIKNHKLTLDYTLGLRVFKTALAIFISVVIAYVSDNANAVYFSSIAVVACMQRDYKTTLSVGCSTFIGTIFGGVLGFLVVELCNVTSQYSYVLEFLLILIAVFIVLYSCYFFHSQDMIPITCIILLKMISHYGGLETNGRMLDFLVNRILLFTFIGIVIAVLVNIIPFAEITSYLKNKFTNEIDDCEQKIHS